jgi:hypothetical protein
VEIGNVGAFSCSGKPTELRGYPARPVIRFFLLLLFAMVLALVLQHFLPPVPTIEARVFLVPIIMFYGAVALPTWGMLALAFTGGLMWDLLHTQFVDGNVEIGLGWSIVLYAALSAIMSGLRPLFQRGRWEIHCVLCGVLTSAIVLAEYLMLSIRRQPVQLVFNEEIWWRIGGAGLTAMFLAPFLFFGLNYLASVIGYDPQPDRKLPR